MLQQHTDMMSRRSALDLNATCQWLGIAVRIDTNSPAILRSAKEWGFSRLPVQDQASIFTWSL